MNKFYIVSFLTFGENELTTEMIQAPDWLTAAKAHSNSLFNYPDIDPENFKDIETAKQYAFDCDGAFDIKEAIVDAMGPRLISPGEPEFGKVASKATSTSTRIIPNELPGQLLGDIAVTIKRRTPAEAADELAEAVKAELQRNPALKGYDV